MRSFVLGALLLSALCASARADLLQTTDGRWIEGVPMRVDGDFVVLVFQAGEVRVPLSMVEDYVIEGVPPFEPKTEQEKAKRAEGLVLLDGKWVRPEVREKALKERIAQRKAEIADARAHQEWRNRRTFASKNFTYESTLPAELNEEFSTKLEAYFELFKKDWGVKVPKDWGKLKVCFYHDGETFRRVGGAPANALAYYKFTEPRELNFFYDRTDPEYTRAIMFHEATHYLIDLIDERGQYPHWINEAMAEYYGASEWDEAKEVWIPGHLQEGRIVDLKTDIEAGEPLALQDLIGDGSKDYRHYTWGWSFVHFMLETPQYEKKFRRYFVDLGRAKGVERRIGPMGFEEVSGEECLRHFLDRMDVDDLYALEKEWYAYVEKLDGKSLRAQERAGLAAFHQGRWKFRAPRYLKAAIDQGSRNPSVWIAYSKCLRSSPEGLQQALDLISKACEMDPLQADFWAERGACLYSLGKQDEGERLIALAREMNPSEPYLEVDIVKALGGDGDGGE